MGAEIEVKVALDDAGAFSLQLQALDFNLDTPRTLERNTLYDTPERSLRARGQILRLREFGSRHVLTHKRHPEHEDLSSRFKMRIETETELSDSGAMAEIFQELGYKPVFRYEKYRTEWSRAGEPGAHVVVDETPIGNFAELEGPPAWIDTTLAQLGVEAGQILTDSYGKLFTAWKRRTGSPAENLTFDETLQAV